MTINEYQQLAQRTASTTTRGGETLPVVRYEGLFETAVGLIHCKDCAHLCYEDLGIYYCGNIGICGQLSPDDYCSRGKRKEKQRNAATD